MLEVSVRGPLEERTGRVVDLGALDALVRREVVAAFDHRNLNIEFPEFAGVVPTTENLVAAVERRLRGKWSAAFAGEWPRLDRIRLEETRRNAFETRF
jgi:6-pyruvoyltetrahydropterin/6-carboxytetrahydropterin synthase